jgi:Protein of unknown function (DUF1761)
MTAKLNDWAVAAAAAAAMLVSSVWYSVLGDAYLDLLRGIHPAAATRTPQAWEVVGQLVRNLVVAFVLAVLLGRLEAATWRSAIGLGLLVWLGFQAMAVLGSVLHEQYPLGLYAIHVGDALLATLTIALVLGTWRRGRGPRPTGR